MGQTEIIIGAKLDKSQTDQTKRLSSLKDPSRLGFSTDKTKPVAQNPSDQSSSKAENTPYKRSSQFQIKTAALFENTQKVEEKIKGAEDLVSSLKAALSEKDPKAKIEKKQQFLKGLEKLKDKAGAINEEIPSASSTARASMPSQSSQTSLSPSNANPALVSPSAGNNSNGSTTEKLSGNDAKKTSSAPISLGDLLNNLKEEISVTLKGNQAKQAQEARHNDNELQYRTADLENPIQKVSQDEKIVGVISKNTDHEIDHLVKTLESQPVSVLQDGPNKDLEQFLDNTIKDLNQKKTSLNIIKSDYKSVDKYERQISPQDLKIPANVQAAESLANAVLSQTTTNVAADLKQAQKRVTPDAVSQLLF